MDGTLNQYLHKIDEDCNKRLYELVECMKLREGITEQLKAENQMLHIAEIKIKLLTRKQKRPIINLLENKNKEGTNGKE